MVIAQLLGGLGNQLFQYAAARRIAWAHNAPLKLDVSGFEHYGRRTYALRAFNIIEEFASAADVASVRGAGLGRRLRQGAERLLPYRRRRWLLERHYHFDPEVLGAGSHVYLEGYWQSEKYFKDIEDIIRSEFTVKTTIGAAGEAIAAEIHSTESVSVHVRRGDYVDDPVVRRVHGPCTEEYYRAAMSHMVGKTATPAFFLFSDDAGAALEDIRSEYPMRLASRQGRRNDYEDFWLMTQCKHHIIANSSFSWWAAWLGSHPGKVVVAPRRWVNTEELDTRDLIPEGWHRI